MANSTMESGRRVAVSTCRLWSSTGVQLARLGFLWLNEYPAMKKKGNQGISTYMKALI
jgi:hypothetical protein